MEGNQGESDLGRSFMLKVPSCVIKIIYGLNLYSLNHLNKKPIIFLRASLPINLKHCVLILFYNLMWRRGWRAAADIILMSHFLPLDSFGSEPSLDFSSGLNRVSQHDIEQVRCDGQLEKYRIYFITLQPSKQSHLTVGFPRLNNV